MKRQPFILILFYCVSVSLYAQEPPCKDWPADCPEETAIGVSHNADSRLNAGLLPAEIAMQDKVRAAITAKFRDAADALHWRMTNLEEVTGLSGMQKAFTPYNLRSPRGMELYFQFIVDDDSLRSWREWKMNDLEKRQAVGAAAGNSYNDVINSPLFKSYMDSANHYQQLYLGYIDKHKSEGAAAFNNKTVEGYTQKMNAWSDKAVALQQKSIDSNGWKSMEDEDIKTTHRFRNASVVYIHFEANAYAGEINETVNTVSAYPSTSAVIAKQAVIKQEENGYYHEFGKWNYMVMLLFGNWLNKEVNGSYLPGFSENRQDDDRSVKKVMSDKVQNMSLTIFGNRRNVEKIAHLLDGANIPQLLDR